jgi:DNA-binding XRE family transcriptional regulator
LVRAKVRTRDVFIEIRGVIPGTLLEVLRHEYGIRLITRTDCGEPMRDTLSAPLYEREPQRMGPGDFLRFYRSKSGLTQSELGKRLGGIPRQNVSGMEGGKRHIGERMARRLAAFFDVSTGRFLA